MGELFSFWHLKINQCFILCINHGVPPNGIIMSHFLLSIEHCSIIELIVKSSYGKLTIKKLTTIKLNDKVNFASSALN